MRFLDNAQISQVIRRIRAAVAHLPDPSVTLVGKKWKSPYLVLASCLLSLRTKDETTLPAAERLFRLASTPARMVELTVAEIEKAIYPVGFYRTKARRLRDISAEILARFSGQVPDTMEGLLGLKGVGRKTANLVLVEGFGQYGVCVDTHVHRISNRLGYVATRTPEETEQALRDRLPRRHWKEYNALLVVWGQNVCRPVSPRCSECPVAGLCRRVGVGTHR
ncbi:MAG: endonuclease III [Candidatus Omnitrophica bacterium]|nr:endonuclease III [Candidatus Omnitrophota bacterium]